MWTENNSFHRTILPFFNVHESVYNKQHGLQQHQILIKIQYSQSNEQTQKIKQHTKYI